MVASPERNGAREGLVDNLFRLLELVKNELKAEDARIELGGKPPSDERLIWVPLAEGQRVVAVVAVDDDEREASRLRLRELVSAFQGSLSQLPTQREMVKPQDALDDALEVLAHQAHARLALVIDDASPMLWGTSGDRPPEDVEDAEHAARGLRLAKESNLDLARILAGEVPAEGASPELSRLLPEILDRAQGTDRGTEAWRVALSDFSGIANLREKTRTNTALTRFSAHEGAPLLARRFANIYWMVLLFDKENFSELHAEAAMIHASAWMTRLVSSLPPYDPNGGGGRIHKLRRLRPV